MLSWMRKNLAFAMALSAMAALAGCSDDKKIDPARKTGSAQVALTVADLVAVDHVTLSITGSGAPITKSLTKVDNTHYTGSFTDIPAGTYSFAADAYADAAGTNKVLTGKTDNVVVVAAKVTQVSIILHDVVPPTGDTKKLPIIDGMASPANATTGETVDVSVTAHSPESHTLTYQWSDNCGGSFNPATDAAAKWTAPATAATCLLSAKVIDAANVTSVTAYLVIVTVEAPSTVVEVSAVVDTFPMVTLGAADAFVVTGATSTPAGLTVGITADVVATASDADGSPVTFSWTSSCPGSFAPDATAATVRFHSDDPYATCTLSVVVADSSTPANTITGSIELTGDPCKDVVCTASDACHEVGVCNPTTGACSNPEKPCPTGQACSLTSTPPGQCVDVCEGFVCPISDACHVAGTCSSATGVAVCSPETAKCATNETCDLNSTPPGQCNPIIDDLCKDVVCTASDLCHKAGDCNPNTGKCSDPVKECTAQDACHETGVCDVTTGCSNPAKECPTGQACSLTSSPPGLCVDLCVGFTCPEASDACHVAGTCSSATGVAVCSPETEKCAANQTCSLTSTPPGQCIDKVTITIPVPKAIKHLGLSRADGVAIDSTNNVYIAGPLFDTQSFGAISVSSAGASDVLLAKYDAVTHDAVWAKAYGDTDEQWTIGLALTQDGTLVSLGNFVGRLNTVTNTTDHPIDYLMGVDAATGDVKWTNMFDNGSGGAILSIAANPNQNIIAVCGYSSQASNMVTPAPTYGGGLRDAIVAVYRSTGEKVWAREIGGAAAEQCSGLAVDAAGDVYAVGRYNGALDLAGPTALPTLGGSLAINWTWVAKFRGTDGATLVDSYVGGRNAADTANAGNHTPSAIAVDSAGNVVIGGAFTVSMVYSTTPTETRLVSRGGTDAFVAKLDPTFAPLWAVRMGSPSSDGVSDIALTATNDVVAVGVHNGTTTGIAEISVPNGSAWSNAFVLKLAGTDGANQFAASYGDEAQAQSASRIAMHDPNYAIVGTYNGTLDFGDGISLTGTSLMSYLLFGMLE